MDTKRNEIIVIMVMAIATSYLLTLKASVDYEDRASLLEKPTTISLGELVENGTGGARHLTLVGFQFGERYVGLKNKNSEVFGTLWVPLFPQGAAGNDIQVVATFHNVSGKDAIDRLIQQLNITGTCSQHPRWLGPETIKQLREAYPGASNTAYVINITDDVPSAESITAWFAAAVGLLSLSLAGCLYLWWKRMQERLHAKLEEDYAPDDFQEDERQLGNFEQEFVPTLLKHVFVMVFCSLFLLASLIGAVLAAVYNDGVIRIFLMLAAFVAAGLAVWGIDAMRKRLAWRVRLHENGFLWLRLPRPEFVVWNKVRCFREVRMIMNGIQTDHQFRLDMVSGRQVMLDSTLRDIASLASTVAQRTFAARLARLQGKLRSHGSIKFGAVTVDADGLTQRGSHVPWVEIDGADIQQRGFLNLVTVRLKNQKGSWFKALSPRFPNLDVFVTIVNERTIS